MTARILVLSGFLHLEGWWYTDTYKETNMIVSSFFSHKIKKDYHLILLCKNRYIIILKTYLAYHIQVPLVHLQEEFYNIYSIDYINLFREMMLHWP